MKLPAAAMAACLVGTVTSARAYDYLDSRGYRHWCQLSCERKGIHVPKAGEVKPREGKVVAQNIIASVYGAPKKPFSFKTLGALAAIGRRTGVARILGVNFSGFLAWFLWR